MNEELHKDKKHFIGALGAGMFRDLGNGKKAWLPNGGHRLMVYLSTRKGHERIFLG